MSLSNEWELSKENIQPIQQGRKAGVLRAALAVHPDDHLLQKQRTFEQQLRIYDGDDPLSVWCEYIKWVEQNYPKGGREGNIGRLIQQCLSILKDEEKYQNDDRFVDIWLKFANMSIRPVEVYTNMYNRNIGCKTSRFFIAWAWEMEQLGNFKQADEILTDGIQRLAQPIEALKSARAQLEVRLATTGQPEKIPVRETQRSAFTILKPQEKNRAPILRIGIATESPTRESLLVGHKQPKKRTPSKLPFKIHGSENVSSTSLHSGKGSLFVLNSNTTKENEKKPSKWSNKKLPQNVESSAMLKPKAPEFPLHYDDEPQPSSAQKIPPGTRVLTPWKDTNNPPVALFEPPDPTKKVMYDKQKVYGGSEEYSFEEIRAAVWLAKHRKLEKEKKRLEDEREKEEMKKQLLLLQKKIESLESIAHATPIVQAGDGSQIECLPPSKTSSGTCETQPAKGIATTVVSQANCSNSSNVVEDCKKQCFSSVSSPVNQRSDEQFQANFESRHQELRKLVVPGMNESKNVSVEISQRSPSTTNVVANMVQELYNDSLNSNAKKNSSSLLGNNSRDGSDIILSFKPNSDSNEAISEKKNLPEERFKLARIDGQSDVKALNFGSVKKKQSAFSLYRDPTEEARKKPQVFPFEIYQDSVAEPQENIAPKAPQKEISVCEKMVEVDENVPPNGYVQNHEKRELAGILQPSKNIFYVPLEKQLEEKDDDDDNENENDTSEILAQPLPISDDVTMIPPLNTEQFALAAPYSSTPFTKPIIHSTCREQKSTSIQDHSIASYSEEGKDILLNHLQQILEFDAPPKVTNLIRHAMDMLMLQVSQGEEEKYYKIMQEDLEICLELSKNADLKQMISSAIDLTKSSVKKKKSWTPEKKDTPSNTNFPITSRSWHLSTIMENSREGSTKSSSSSSSCSSLNSNSRFKSLPLSCQGSGVASSSRCSTEKSFTVPSYTKEISKLSSHDASENSVQQISFTCTDINPFDASLTNRFLDSLSIPVTSRENFYSYKDTSVCIRIGTDIKLGNINCLVENLFAEGGYAKIYSAKVLHPNNRDNKASLPDRHLALKVCRTGGAWEFYICSELHERLSMQKKLPDISSSVIKVDCAVAFKRNMVLVSKLCKHGTLLDVVNVYKSKKIPVPEYLAMYFALEMMLIVSRVHECNIVHADIKPDNFVINELPQGDVIANISKETSCLQLIDFGRAIDLTFFAPGITFKTDVKTDSFQCTEMKDGRPWVFQTDWYGVLGCIHVLLFSEYMSVRKNRYNQWEPVSKFKRYWQVDLWQTLFHTLLNIPSCYTKPDLKPFISSIEETLEKQANNFEKQIQQLLNILNVKQ